MIKPDVIVGISGGSGSGKTSILRSLFQSYSNGEICVVSQDNYYKPIEEQVKDANGQVNFDLPEAIDLDHFVHDMNELSNGNSIVLKEYTFNNAARKSKEIVVNPARILLIEGLFIFHFKPITEKLDLKVFVDTDHNRRLDRRIKRDGTERGYSKESVLYQWENHVEPAYTKFLEPYKKDCQLIINNNEDYNEGMNSLVKMISSHQ